MGKRRGRKKSGIDIPKYIIAAIAISLLVNGFCGFNECRQYVKEQQLSETEAIEKCTGDNNTQSIGSMSEDEEITENHSDSTASEDNPLLRNHLMYKPCC